MHGMAMAAERKRFRILRLSWVAIAEICEERAVTMTLCNPDYHGGMICRRDYPGASACTRYGGIQKCLKDIEVSVKRDWLLVYRTYGEQTEKS